MVLAERVYGFVGFRGGLFFYVQEHLKAQLAVVLILKHHRRWGHSLKSHPTDWEKPGLERVTPSLQGIGLSLGEHSAIRSTFI